MGVERYGCILRSVANNLGEIPRKIEARHPLFSRVFWGANTWGLVPSCLPTLLHTLGYACIVYAPPLRLSPSSVLIHDDERASIDSLRPASHAWSRRTSACCSIVRRLFFGDTIYPPAPTTSLSWNSQQSGTKKEPKPKLLSPDIFRWGGGLPREGVGAKKFGMFLEPGILLGYPGSARKV